MDEGRRARVVFALRNSSILFQHNLDSASALGNLPRFVEETGIEPISVSCETGEGLDVFREKLREIVAPETRFHHTHAETPDLKDMPDTTGDEIPAEALRFATFLKLDKPKAKSHPSRGNIH